MNKITDFLSADEQKLSALILCLFGMAGIAGYSYLTSGDISSNMKDLIETLIFAIAGMNIAGTVASHMKGSDGDGRS